MLIAYTLTFSILLVIFYIGRKRNSCKITNQGYYNPNSISVIIPFRNEQKNLSKLMDSIEKLSIQPLEFIWVNDHSTDDSIEYLKKLNNNYPFIELSELEQGKKAAIRKGIEVAAGSFILTWDADIQVDADYFINLKKIQISELCILPVRMKGKTFLEQLYELDYYFLNSINLGISGFSNPIVASGANLLFNKNVFKEIDSINAHKHIASGDDMFLLQDFKKTGKTIQVIDSSELVVETPTPHTFIDFFKQRIRWVAKSKYINDTSTSLVSLFGVIYIIGFVYLLFTSTWLFVLIFKIILDLLIFLPYIKLVDRKSIAFTIPIFTLLYPFYFVGIVGCMLLLKPDWKGRK